MPKVKTFLVAALIVAVPTVALCGFGYIAWRSGKIPIKAAQAIVMSYIRNNANDPDAMEVVAWGVPKQHKTGNISIDLKYRISNPMLGKILHLRRFWIKDREVIETYPLEEDLGPMNNFARNGREWELSEGSKPGSSTYDRAMKEFWDDGDDRGHKVKKD